MTDDLVQRLKGHSENMERDKGKFVRFIDVATCTEAAELIEAQAAEIERLREVIKTQANAVRTLHSNEATEINRLRKQRHEWHLAVTSIDSEREANAILTAEIERLLEALAGPMAWLDSWARHVGNCQGGYFCTCGLVAARSELSAAIAAVKGA